MITAAIPDQNSADRPSDSVTHRAMRRAGFSRAEIDAIARWPVQDDGTIDETHCTPLQRVCLMVFKYHKDNPDGGPS